MRNWKWILIFFIVLTLFGLFLPFWITQKNWFWDLGRTDANEIGDAIGGILGPYFSFIGSCLVAYTIYLQLETRKEDKQKEYEKTIFENCLESLKTAEQKIYELNAADPLRKYAVNHFFDEYFKSNWTSDTLKVHLFMNEINSATNLFHSTYMRNKGYFIIIINQIDTILRLTKSTALGKWNKEKRDDHALPNFFLNINSLEAYNEVKIFYCNIKNIKTKFVELFDKNFQSKELKQLSKTCNWLESFELDLNDYISSLSKETELFAKSFGNLELTSEETIEFNNARTEIHKIKTKYGIPFDPSVYS